MNKFFCNKCQKTFEDDGKKQEYTSPIYGPCWKRVARCPDCGAECDEFRQKSSGKKTDFDFDSYVENLRSRGGCCRSGGCCN
ncbi:MAG: hypothetical protein NC931_06955 [Candidatus Omnitrophica bacterium]|nr:hypothetical protein [Candidatus Omnitrophota bacterium]MCM8821812.1 hypothetical protein [Candidatus Omnitrophota bacterium]